MDNRFITANDYDASIHREILDSLLRTNSPERNPQLVAICEDRAISEMRGYMNKRYDCDAIFSARAEERLPLVVMFAVDIAIYHIFTQHNPYKMAKIRQDRYERALEWLRGILDGDVTIDGAPLLPVEELNEKSRWQIAADEVRPTLR